MDRVIASPKTNNIDAFIVAPSLFCRPSEYSVYTERLNEIFYPPL
jgi:hypothetical protein